VRCLECRPSPPAANAPRLLDQECQSDYKSTAPTPFKWKSQVKERTTPTSTGEVVGKPTLVSDHTFVSRVILIPSSGQSPAAPRDAGILLLPGRARGTRPRASPTASNGNSLHPRTAVLTSHRSFLVNPATITPERTAAYVHPAGRGPVDTARAAHSLQYYPAQDHSHWKAPQQVSSPTFTSRQGQPGLLLALSRLEACYTPSPKSL